MRDPEQLRDEILDEVLDGVAALLPAAAKAAAANPREAFTRAVRQVAYAEGEAATRTALRHAAAAAIAWELHIAGLTLRNAVDLEDVMTDAD